jgi:hypothetical protein
VGGLNEKLKIARKKIDVLLCAAVGTANHQHGLEARTVHGRHANMLKNYNVWNLSLQGGKSF